MTPEEMEKFGEKAITITRHRVAEIIATRIAEEQVVMKECDLDPVARVVFSEILTNVCADIMHEMFDTELEVEE